MTSGRGHVHELQANFVLEKFKLLGLLVVMFANLGELVASDDFSRVGDNLLY